VTYGLFGFHIQGHILFLTLVLLLGSILVDSIAFVMSEPSNQINWPCWLRHVRVLLRHAGLLPLAVSGCVRLLFCGAMLMPSYLESSNLLLPFTLISPWRSSTSLCRHDGVLVFYFLKSNCCSSPGPDTFVFDFAQPRCCCSSLFGETDSCLSSCQDSGPPSQIAASCYVESCMSSASLSRRPVPLTTFIASEGAMEQAWLLPSGSW